LEAREDRVLKWWRELNSKHSGSCISSALAIEKNDGWSSLNLSIANKINKEIWIEEGVIHLHDLEADPLTLALADDVHVIRQLIAPRETLVLGLARTIYRAARNPQGTYTCTLAVKVRYSIDGAWSEESVLPCRLQMRVLIPVELRRLKKKDRLVSGLERSIHASGSGW
jgi:hypothetical protein